MMKTNYVEGLPATYVNVMDMADELKLNRADLRLALANGSYEKYLAERGHGDLASIIRKFNKGENGTLRNTYGINGADWSYYKRYRRLRPKEEKKDSQKTFTVSDETYERLSAFKDAVNNNSDTYVSFKDIVEVAIDEYLQRRLQ